MCGFGDFARPGGVFPAGFVGAGDAVGDPLGGALGAPLLPLEPLYPFKYLVLVLVIVALSGFGNVKATVFVAVFVGIVDTAGRYFLPDSGAFTIYVLLILLMVWRPDGLLTRRSTR